MSRNDHAWQLVSWTPQIVWAVLAVVLLIGLVVGLRRERVVWWLMWMPYGMLLGAIPVQMMLFGIAPFPLTTVQQYDSETVFWQTVPPRLCGLGILGAIHLLLLPLLAISRRRSSSS
jgi:hypothetical protein